MLSVCVAMIVQALVFRWQLVLQCCVFPLPTLHIHLWVSRFEASGFTTLSGLPFRFAFFMLSRGLLPFTRCRLCQASFLMACQVASICRGGSSEHSDNQNLCSPCGLVECVAWVWLLRVKPLGRVSRCICARRLVLCLFMPSVTTIASKT